MSARHRSFRSAQRIHNRNTPPRERSRADFAEGSLLPSFQDVSLFRRGANLILRWLEDASGMPYLTSELQTWLLHRVSSAPTSCRQSRWREGGHCRSVGAILSAGIF